MVGFRSEMMEKMGAEAAMAPCARSPAERCTGVSACTQAACWPARLEDVRVLEPQPGGQHAAGASVSTRLCAEHTAAAACAHP